MTEIIVVDVGNTRIKWGRCERGRVVEVAALPADAPDAWRRQLDQWPEAQAARWVLSGVHPARRDTLAGWLRQIGVAVQMIDSYRQLPLMVQVDAPAKVGIDRLLNAVAANTRRPAHAAAVIVDAGSAVTVDVVDPIGVFRGGAIFPGLRLMAQALHEHTAQLPLVAVDRAEPPPGTSTAQAIRIGIVHALVGGIAHLLAAYRREFPEMDTYVTGGDAPLLGSAPPGFGMPCVLWPEMTLAGILHSVPKAATHG